MQCLEDKLHNGETTWMGYGVVQPPVANTTTHVRVTMTQGQADSILPPSERNKRTSQDNSYDSNVATKRVCMSSNSQDADTSDGDRSGSLGQPRELETFRQQIQRLSSQNKSFEKLGELRTQNTPPATGSKHINPHQLYSKACRSG